MVDISDDTPLRLGDAVKIAFPMGGMTISGLRREIQKGRLECEIIAGKAFVTLRGIKAMREKCRVRAKEQGSGSVPSAPTKTEPQQRPSGSSEMERTRSPLDALNAKLDRLKEGTPKAAPARKQSSPALDALLMTIEEQKKKLRARRREGRGAKSD